MKIFMLTDLEGVAMVARFVQTRGNTEKPELKYEAMRLLTAEVNAAIDGVLDVAPDAEIVVHDSHGSGGIDVTSFHPRAKLISMGNLGPPHGMDASFNALFFVGQHAMGNTLNANLCHTYSSKWFDYFKINGEFVGEFGARAMMAGTLGVPTVFISGDDMAVAEARALVPGIHGAVVKWSLRREIALHLSVMASRERIRRTASEAVRGIAKIAPVKVAPPYEQEIRVVEGGEIETFLKRGAQRIDDRTVILRSDNFMDLFV